MCWITPPRSPDERLIKPTDFQRITREAGVISACALVAYSYALAQYGIGPKSSTVAFMSLTIGQVLHTFSCRSESRRWLSFKNPCPVIPTSKRRLPVPWPYSSCPWCCPAWASC